MINKKITTLALAGIIVLGSTSLTAFASETEKTPAGSQFRSEQTFNRENLGAIKGNLEEKGITLEEAKENFAAKLEAYAAEKGITVEEAQAQIDTLRANGRTFEGIGALKGNLEEKGITLEEAKENFTAKLEAYAAEKGITVEEAQAQIDTLRANGKTFEGLKAIGSQKETI